MFKVAERYSARIEGTVARHATDRDAEQASARSTASKPHPAGPVPESPIDVPPRGWLAVAKRAGTAFTANELTDRAAALTYYGVLAIFPGLLVLVAALGLMSHNATQKVLDNVGAVAPAGVKSFLDTIIQQTQNRHSAAGLAAIVGILLAVWSASGYVAAFMRATNHIYGVREGRPVWKTAPVRLAVTIAVLVLLIASAIMVLVTGSVASQAGELLGIGHTAVTVWEIAKWPVLLIVVSLMLSLLYWACPNVKHPGFGWITPGGLVAVLIWLLASAGFGVYAAYAGSYNKTYGSLATVIIFLVWLWISNCAVLFGAQLNAELERGRAMQAGVGPNVEPFVPLRDTRKLTDVEKAKVEQAQAQRAGAKGEQGNR